MKKSMADIAFLLVGGRSVLPSGPSTLSESLERVIEDVTGANQSSDHWSPVKHRRFEMTVDGFYEIGTGKWHDALMEGEHVLMYAPIGNAVGDELVAFEASRTEYSRLPARGEFHKARAVYKAESGPERDSRILAPLAGRTSNGNQEYDWGVGTEKGGAAYLSVSDYNGDGSDGLLVRVEEFDGADWSPIATFTVVTAAPSADVVRIDGEIKQLTRVTWEFTGSPGENKTATFAVGLSRK